MNLVRIDKYISQSNLFTRAEIKYFIKSSKVIVDNKIIKDASLKIPYNTDIICNDTLINLKEYEYYLLNKPCNCVTALKDNKYDTVMKYIHSKRDGLVPVGRLDIDTTGILLITNNGELNHKLCSPKNHVKKIYIATIDQPIKDIQRAKYIFNSGIVMDGKMTLPAQIDIINDKKVKITLCEGKYHQVKRMIKILGSEVVDLNRVAYGGFDLNSIKIDLGQYIEIDDELVRKHLLEEIDE